MVKKTQLTSRRVCRYVSQNAHTEQDERKEEDREKDPESNEKKADFLVEIVWSSTYYLNIKKASLKR